MDSKQFIEQAREKNLTDDQIVHMLVDNGWGESRARAEVLGLSVPAPPQESNVSDSANTSLAAHSPPESDQHRADDSLEEPKSISALEAALQHVLLWVFTLTSSIMIGMVSAVLFSSNANPSANTLITYLVLETVTFIPFVIFFYLYLKKLKNYLELRTGKVWSIITIVLHSLGLIGALVSVLLAVLLIDSQDQTPVAIAGTAIAIMNALVVGAYVAANFAKGRYGLRKRLLRIFPITLALLITIFGVFALLNLGPLRADETTVKNLVQTTEAIRDYAKDNNRLPANLETVSDASTDVTYRRLNATTYELCATFQREAESDYNFGTSEIKDDYISDYFFTYHRSGEDCFTIESQYLLERSRENLRRPSQIDERQNTPPSIDSDLMTN